MSFSSHELLGYTINNYTLSKVLGSGANGIVYLATSSINHQKYAIKVILKKTENSDIPLEFPSSKIFIAKRTPVSQKSTYELYKSHFGQALFKEVIHHSAVHSHPNIISIIEVLESQQFIGVVLEYCELGDLFGALAERNWYVGNQDSARALIYQLLDAVEYCHSRSVYHCDLKPENILIDKDGTCLKIADFGLASTSLLCKDFGRGSSYYMSPENIATNVIYQKRSTASRSNPSLEAPKTREPLRSKGYPKSASDVWALGVIFLNLLFGRNPWKTACIQSDHAYRDYAANYNSLKEILPVSEELNKIMALVFDPDPYRRISIACFRAKLSMCEVFINPYKQFSWFKPCQELPSPVSIVIDSSEGEMDINNSGMLSEITQGEIEKLQEHFFNVVLTNAEHASWTPRQGKATTSSSKVYTFHDPSTVSPPTSDSSLASSPYNYGSTQTSEDSDATTINSASTCYSSKAKLKYANPKTLTLLYPFSHDKHSQTSFDFGGKIGLYHPSSSIDNLCTIESERSNV